MARLSTADNIRVLKIKAFLGLNENPDGDTKIRDGELSALQNFRITRDGHLQVRPGTRTVCRLRAAWDEWAGSHAPTTDAPVFCGAWEGMAGAGYHILAAFGGVVFDITQTAEWTSPGAVEPVAVRAVGTCTQDQTSFFGFGGKVYLLNGHEYKSWDGSAETEFAEVAGYVPLTVTACTPEGKGTALENVNRLNGLRRVRFSPDGTAAAFHLPETGVDAVVAVEGTTLTHTDDRSAGVVTFASAPPKGTNTLTITYRKGQGKRGEVAGMRFAELYNGAQDTRVFLYGDGTNKTIYSGIDGDTGLPSAEYFPDLYEAAVGESNTPITALVRHHARLLAFKAGSTWSIQYGAMTLEDGQTTAAFFVEPVNRQLGNEATGQVRLLENNPLTLDGGSVYQWRSTSNSGNITSDERSARRISDRVTETLRGLDFSRTATFNRKREHEFWFLCGETAVILNYASDAWYVYQGIPFRAALEVEGDVLGFAEDGRVLHLSRSYRNDDGAPIDAYAATGAMDFGRDWQLKYSPMVFVTIQPESNARITVTAETNRRSDYPDKMVAMSFVTFHNADFNHWSFGVNRKPQVRRVKLKVKKAVFYKLVFKSDSASATATILETDVQLRYAGNVK